MTIDQLKEYSIIKKSAHKIFEKLEQLNAQMIGAIKPNDSGSSKNSKISRRTETIALKRIKLKDLLNAQYEELISKELEIETFISTIEDKNIRYIIREKYLELRTWDEIAEELFVDRTAPLKMLQRYMEAANGN